MNATELVMSMDQIFNLITINGDLKTYIVEGPMGSGKSTMVQRAEEVFGDQYHYVNIDCTQLSDGDVVIPDTDKEAGVTRYLPNELLVGDGVKPMFINFDEIGKPARNIQNMIAPIILERRAGMHKLPKGSIVFGTTNLGAEGVGDLFQPHFRNRVDFVEMRYPTNVEWMQWGLTHDVTPGMLVWAKENPQLFHSFKDHPNPDTNKYIFHPKAQRRSFVTPRSLYLASIELREDRRAKINDKHATFCALAGNIGVEAAADLMVFIDLDDKTPSWASVISAPDTALVPKDTPTALVMMVFRAVAKSEKDTLNAVMTYIRRFPKEMQMMFVNQILRVPKKAAIAALNAEFKEWITANHYLMK